MSTTTSSVRKKRITEIDGQPHPIPIETEESYSSCSSSSSSSSSSRSPAIEPKFSPSSAAVSLYADAIHSILHFVEFAELINVLRINKAWSAAVVSLRPRKSASITCNIARGLRVKECPNSPLLAHVSHIAAGEGAEYRPLYSYCTLFSFFPNIQSATRLRIGSGSGSLAASHAHLPSTLTSVHLYPIDPSEAQLSIHLISELPQLRVLKFFYKSKSFSPSSLNFTTLSKLQKLQELTVSDEFPAVFDTFPCEFNPISLPNPLRPVNQSLILAVHLMPSLRRLDLGPANLQDLQMLVAQSKDSVLQLEWINTGPCDRTYVDTLSQLSSLTELSLHAYLDIRAFGPPTGFDDASFLLKLQRLSKFSLTFGDRAILPPPENLMENMMQLNQLRELTLQHYALEDRHLESLLPNLTMLSKLSLVYCLTLRRLTWLRTLAPRLISLELRECVQLDAEDLHEVRSPPLLESLILHGSFDENFDEDKLRCFRPPSEILPCLRRFSYERNLLNDPIDESLFLESNLDLL